MIGFIIGMLIMLIFTALAVNAPIIKWKARTLKGWNITYKDASIVALKGTAGGFLVGQSISVLFMLTGMTSNEAPLNLLYYLAGLLAWWIIQSKTLYLLAAPPIHISDKEARQLSIVILGFTLIIPISLSILLAILVI